VPATEPAARTASAALPSSAPSRPVPADGAARTAVRALVVVAASFLLGGLTSYAQGFLPDAASPFANSSSGWTVLTVLLVAWFAGAPRARTWHAAVLGAASFVLLVLGYTVAADLRGFVYHPLLFGLVGVVAGPFVGVAAAWLRTQGVRAALATALLAGIGVGEGTYGLLTVAEHTGATYWVVAGVASLVLLAAMLARRVRGTWPVVVTVAGTAVVAGAFYSAYIWLGTVGSLG